MNKILFWAILTVFVMNKITAMEYIINYFWPKKLGTVLNCPQLPKDMHSQIIFHAFDGIVDKKLDLVENIKNLFAVKARIMRVNKSYKEIIDKNKDWILQKFADELRKKYTVQELEIIFKDLYKFIQDSDKKAILNDEVIKVLRLAGVNIDAKHPGPAFSTALVIAMLWGRLDLMKILIKNGANVNFQGANGKTPLIYSFILYKQHPYSIWSSTEEMKERISILLDAGAQINLRDNSGKSALDYAQELNLDEIAALLASRGAQ